MRLVLDTNILISALIRNGFARDFIITKSFEYEFLTPAYTLSEINKYNQYILKKAEITHEQYDFLLDTLFNLIKIINPLTYSKHLKEADKLIEHKTDVPFLACAIFFNCPIWSDDKHFQKQNKVKVFTTKEMKTSLN